VTLHHGRDRDHLVKVVRDVLLVVNADETVSNLVLDHWFVPDEELLLLH
jgi:hypothetical protein